MSGYKPPTFSNVQDVFDYVCERLIEQGQPARDPETSQCQYRSDGNRKCAAGWLIADEHYRGVLEGMSAHCNVVKDALYASGVPTEAIELIQRLQRIHDGVDVGDWPIELREVAEFRGLEQPACIREDVTS